VFLKNYDLKTQKLGVFRRKKHPMFLEKIAPPESQ
jgi:hypothetical protein